MKFLSATGALIKRRKKTSLAVAIAVLALAAFFVIRATNQQEDPSYDTYTVKAAPALVLQGKVNAASQVPVTVQASGQFQSLSVSDGQTVSQGQELMRYADDSKQSEIDEQANENTASQSKLTNLNNLLTSLNQQLASAKAAGDSETATSLQSQVTDTQNSIADAKATLQSGQSKLTALQKEANQTVTAPVSGIVHVVESEGSAPKLTILSDQRVIKAKVSEYDRSKVKANQEVTVTSDVTGKKASGEVLSVASLPAGNNLTNDTSQTVAYYPVQVENALHERVGTDVHVKVSQHKLEVPSTAVFHHAGQQVVLEYRQGKVYRTAVATKKVNGVTYVKSGLTAGDRVISDPSASLKKKNGVAVDVN